MRKYRHVYIAGPMTGLPKKNFPEFTKAAKRLRKRGFKVVNPAELELIKPLCVSWEECLRRDMKHILLKCFAVATLNGWKRSRGANLEVYVAKQLDMPVHTLEYWLDKGG